MAAIDFPSSPTVGQTFTASGKEWEWDGTAWQLLNVTSSLHAATHAAAGSDPVSIAQSQVTNLTTDLSAKASIESPTFTGTVVLPATTSIGDITSTEISYVDGVTSSIQTQLNNKEKSIPLQSTEPTSPSSSDLWVDSVSMQLKVYNGTSWVALGAAVDDSQLVISQRMFA